MGITNDQLKDYRFLAEMLRDKYFPPSLVEKGQQILVRMCERIEAELPTDLDSLYKITQCNRSLSGVLLPAMLTRNNPPPVQSGGTRSDQSDGKQQQVAAA